MQEAYAKIGFDLKLVNSSRIVDDVIGKGFYNENTQIDDYDAYLSFLQANRRGGYDSLNMYFFSDLFSDIGGQCNLPQPGTQPGTQAFYTDGCIVNGDRMPGMWAESVNMTEPQRGHIAIHEAGHWFGLYHTFQGRLCDSINDQIADTPAQSGGSSGCPVGRDSCPDLPGLDPIHNYMDYSDDTW